MYEDNSIYFIYILILFILYISFLDIYNKYYVSFIVVSNKNNGILKIHSKPISLNKAIEKQKNLKEQYNYQRISNEKEVLIIKFVKFQ